MPPRRRRFFLFDNGGRSADRYTLLDTKAEAFTSPYLTRGGKPITERWYSILSFNARPDHPQYGIALGHDLPEHDYIRLRNDPNRLGKLITGDELEPSLWKWLLAQLKSFGATKLEITELFTGMKGPP